MSIDAASIESAKAKAKRTDKPQPVTDDKGNVVYYVTPDGTQIPTAYAGLWNNTTAVTPKGTDPRTGITYSRDALGNVTAVEHPGDRARQEAADKAAASAQAQATASSDAVKAGAANTLHGYVWVNGQQQVMVLDPKTGQYVVNYATPGGALQGGGLQTKGKDGKVTTDPTQPNVDGSAFGALPSSTGLEGSKIFNLSTGPANIFNGRSVAGDGFGGTSGLGSYTPATGDHSAAANTVGNSASQPARNQMTVAAGVQWFLNLAAQHKDQYQHLVDMLHQARYLSDAQWANARGGYSSDAAQQFALATMDLANVNTTDAGKNLGLFDFLNGKAQAGADSAAAVAQPVTRNYQDPATLAYAARQAAQNVLGRALTPAEEKAFEGSFRGKEDAYYNNVDSTNQAQASAAAGGTRGPANTLAQPDASGEAQGYVQGDQFTNQRNGYSMLEYLKAFQQLLSNGSL